MEIIYTAPLFPDCRVTKSVRVEIAFRRSVCRRPVLHASFEACKKPAARTALAHAFVLLIAEPVDENAALVTKAAD